MSIADVADAPAGRVAPPEDEERVVTFRTQGTISELWHCTAREVVISGSAGTGKTRGCLELLHSRIGEADQRVPQGGAPVRALLLRKTYASLKSTAIITFDEEVHPDWDGVIFQGDTKKRPAQYVYPNGSTLVVGGLDNAMKVMSAAYDMIYVPECTELDLKDWEALLSRIDRPGHPKPLGFCQLLGDCNPQGPTHWAKQRAEAGQLVMLTSTHEDNPAIYNVETGEYTADGLSYIATLDRLTGVRYLRLRKGFWAAAEGMVYQDAWYARRNLIDRADVEIRNARTGRAELPRTWPRYLAIDFGFSHPFVCQWWAQDPDGRLYLYREIYMSNRLIQTHAQDILNTAGWSVTGGRLTQARVDGDPLPYQLIADPEDAEGRAQLARYLGCAITPAHKEVRQGIQAVAARMRVSGDSKPRLLLLRDSLVERDPLLVERRVPTCMAEEVESYVWRRGPDGQPLEEPLKINDHGLDAARYVCAQIDLHPMSVDYGPNIWG